MEDSCTCQYISPIIHHLKTSASSNMTKGRSFWHSEDQGKLWRMIYNQKLSFIYKPEVIKQFDLQCGLDINWIHYGT